MIVNSLRRGYVPKTVHDHETSARTMVKAVE
jgi:hypothetical protein